VACSSRVIRASSGLVADNVPAQASPRGHAQVDIPRWTSPRGHPHAGAERRRAPNPVLLDAPCLFSFGSMTVWLTGRAPSGISVRSRRDPRWIPVRPLRRTPRHPLKTKPRPRRECNVRGSRFREVLQKFFTRKITCQNSSIDRRRAVADAPESGRGRAVDRSRPTFRSLRRLRRRATDGHPRGFEGSGQALRP
jgi:hypothetical protein